MDEVLQVPRASNANVAGSIAQKLVAARWGFGGSKGAPGKTSAQRHAVKWFYRYLNSAQFMFLIDWKDRRELNIT